MTIRTHWASYAKVALAKPLLPLHTCKKAKQLTRWTPKIIAGYEEGRRSRD